MKLESMNDSEMYSIACYENRHDDCDTYVTFMPAKYKCQCECHQGEVN